VTIETAIVLEEFYGCIYIYLQSGYTLPILKKMVAKLLAVSAKFGQKNLKINSFKHFFYIVDSLLERQM
jgi:hypothetical protein